MVAQNKQSVQYRTASRLRSSNPVSGSSFHYSLKPDTFKDIKLSVVSGATLSPRPLTAHSITAAAQKQPAHHLLTPENTHTNSCVCTLAVSLTWGLLVL